MVHCDAVQVPNLESARWVLKIDVASLRWSWRIFRVGGEELARPIRVDDCRPVDSVSDYLNGLHWRLLRCLRHAPHPGAWVASASAGLIPPPTKVGAVQASMSGAPGEPRQPSWRWVTPRRGACDAATCTMQPGPRLHAGRFARQRVRPP